MSKADDDLPTRLDGRFVVWSRQSEHWVCQECGAFVADYEKHDRWHDK